MLEPPIAARRRHAFVTRKSSVAVCPVVGHWASGQAVGVDIERGPEGAYRIVGVRTPTASP